MKSEFSFYTSSDYSLLHGIESLEEMSESYQLDGDASHYTNEVFILFYSKYFEWFKANSQFSNPVNSNCIDSSLWNQAIYDSRKVGTSHTPFLKKIGLYFSIVFLFCLYTLATFGKAVVKTLFSGHCPPNSETICIVRSEIAYNKILASQLFKNIDFRTEDLAYTNKSIPSMFSLVSFFWLMKSFPRYFHASFSDLVQLNVELGLNFNSSSRLKILKYFSRRIGIKCIFEFVLEKIIKENDYSELVTGNKEDRFAMIEKSVGESHSLLVTCVPHGLEYGFKVPGGVVGDIFYVTSLKAKNTFCTLYPEVRTIFEPDVCKNIMGLKYLDKYLDRRIVFFTESRDVNVNVDIICGLMKSEVNFLVKLHPKDNASNYVGMNIEFIDDYASAIRGNICLCRKSTIALEALYNDSIPICFVENSRDDFYVSHVFPSLSTEGISICRTMSELNKQLAYFE